MYCDGTRFRLMSTGIGSKASEISPLRIPDDPNGKLRIRANWRLRSARRTQVRTLQMHASAGAGPRSGRAPEPDDKAHRGYRHIGPPFPPTRQTSGSCLACAPVTVRSAACRQGLLWEPCGPSPYPHVLIEHAVDGVLAHRALPCPGAQAFAKVSVGQYLR